MRKCFAGCLTVFLGAASLLGAGDRATTASHDWPQWRGPNRDAVSTETGLLQEWPSGGPKLLWDSKKVNDGKGIGRGFSSVSIVNGKLFTMGDNKAECFVFALDAETGKQLWATAVGPVRAKGGGYGGPRGTPTVDGDRLYAVNAEGELSCLNVADGKLLWQKSYAKEFGGKMMSGWDYSESPLVDGDKVVCTPGGDKATLVALHKLTGEVLWKAAVPNGGGSGYSSIVAADVGGIRQYITLLRECIVGVDARDGRFLWRYDRITNRTANIPTALVRDDLVFCTTGYGAGAALLKLVPKNGGIEAKELYYLRGKELQNHHGGLIWLGDYIYGGHGNNQGLPFCLNMKTGKFAWGPERGPGTGSAAVVYADGRLYFRYQNGVMALVEATPKRYHLISQFELPGYTDAGTPSWPHPVVVNGKLYIRGNDVLLCYDVKQH